MTAPSPTPTDRAHAALHAELAALDAAGADTAALRQAIQRWVCAVWLEATRVGAGA